MARSKGSGWIGSCHLPVAGGTIVLPVSRTSFLHRAPSSSRPAIASGVSSSSTASPAAMVTGLALKVPAWATSGPVPPGIENGHDLLSSGDSADREAAADHLAEDGQVRGVPKFALSARAMKPERDHLVGAEEDVVRPAESRSSSSPRPTSGRSPTGSTAKHSSRRAWSRAGCTCLPTAWELGPAARRSSTARYPPCSARRSMA